MQIKSEEPSSSFARDGDISPINRSLSNLADENKPSATKASEPAFELRPNFSRVTPAQVVHVSFPVGSRYRPVRPVSANPNPVRTATEPVLGPSSTASERYAGGGGILILVDSRPDDEAEYLEFETPTNLTTVAAVTTSQDTQVLAVGPHISLDADAPEAGPPEPFEVGTTC